VSETVSGMIPEIVAKWVSGHGMPSSYLCLTCDVDESVTKQSSQRPSLQTCRSLSVSSSPISS